MSLFRRVSAAMNRPTLAHGRWVSWYDDGRFSVKFTAKDTGDRAYPYTLRLEVNGQRVTDGKFKSADLPHTWGILIGQFCDREERHREAAADDAAEHATE